VRSGVAFRAAVSLGPNPEVVLIAQADLVRLSGHSHCPASRLSDHGGRRPGRCGPKMGKGLSRFTAS
jgi:hypothetical protein